MATLGVIARLVEINAKFYGSSTILWADIGLVFLLIAFLFALIPTFVAGVARLSWRDGWLIFENLTRVHFNLMAVMLITILGFSVFYHFVALTPVPAQQLFLPYRSWAGHATIVPLLFVSLWAVVFFTRARRLPRAVGSVS